MEVWAKGERKREGKEKRDSSKGTMEYMEWRRVQKVQGEDKRDKIGGERNGGRMEADREKNKDSIRRDRKGTGGNIWVEQKKGKEDGEVECIEKKKKVRRKLRK